ncbi:hypothetical protein [Microbacterium sp. LWH12-1.2]|uniref:hypothetical protein n=1 Tax=Microbacterium sp. LWH12-1.2 TaxID=3135259 RepID=UPI00342CBEC8
MTLVRTASTPLAALGVLVLSAAMLVGCSPQAEPTPTPTAAFASEEEAFAAAEETYRAYNDAVNALRSGDNTADPRKFLTGEVLESDVKAARELEEAGLRILGPTALLSFAGVQASHGDAVAEVTALVCLDVTMARALNSNGEDVTAPERSDVYGVEVKFVGNADQLHIAKYEIATDAPC